LKAFRIAISALCTDGANSQGASIDRNPSHETEGVSQPFKPFPLLTCPDLQLQLAPTIDDQRSWLAALAFSMRWKKHCNVPMRVPVRDFMVKVIDAVD
jgi:hypothetical protein